MIRSFPNVLTHIGVQMASPFAFVAALIYAAAWYVFSPDTLEWHGLTTLITLLMTLFIQRAEHRDTQAIHAKLDELLRVNRTASNELINIDEKEPEEIEVHRHS